jgi:hypothetical protein
VEEAVTPQPEEAVSRLGVVAALRLAVVRPRQGAEEVPLPVVPPQERPEDRDMDTGTARDRADTVDMEEKERRAEMGDTADMVHHMKNTSTQLLKKLPLSTPIRCRSQR